MCELCGEHCRGEKKGIIIVSEERVIIIIQLIV